MAETLFIRLGTKATDVIHWLIFADEQQDIIGSGELTGAEQLTLLTDKALNRTIVCLVDSSSVTLKQLKVPGNSARAIRLAAPYMLEDELAQEVEQLFFAFGRDKTDAKGHNCFVAVVAKQQINTWLSWLQQANIRCKLMLPDVLALPLAENAWTSIVLGEQVLVRQDKFQGMAVDAQLWPVLIGQLPSAAEQQMQRYSLLPTSDTVFDEQAMPEQLPLALMAQHYQQFPVNLLQGQFQVKQQRSPFIKHWLIAASVALLVLCFNVITQVTHLASLSRQQAAVEADILQTYQQAFPDTRNLRITTVRSQLKQKLAELGSGSGGTSFLQTLERVKPAFVAVRQLKPASIKFDGKRNELRIQASANGYPPFEQFKNELTKQQLTVTQGALNSHGEQVSGSFSIKGQL